MGDSSKYVDNDTFRESLATEMSARFEELGEVLVDKQLARSQHLAKFEVLARRVDLQSLAFLELHRCLVRSPMTQLCTGALRVPDVRWFKDHAVQGLARVLAPDERHDKARVPGAVLATMGDLVDGDSWCDASNAGCSCDSGHGSGISSDGFR